MKQDQNLDSRPGLLANYGKPDEKTRIPEGIEVCPGWSPLLVEITEIEVRDSRTGYLVLVRYGLGVWPDGRVLGATVVVTWKFRLTFRPGNYFGSCQIGI